MHRQKSLSAGCALGLSMLITKPRDWPRCGFVHALGCSPGANVTTAVTLVVGLPLAAEPAGLRRLLLLDLPAARPCRNATDGSEGFFQWGTGSG